MIVHSFAFQWDYVTKELTLKTHLTINEILQTTADLHAGGGEGDDVAGDTTDVHCHHFLALAQVGAVNGQYCPS